MKPILKSNEIYEQNFRLNLFENKYQEIVNKINSIQQIMKEENIVYSSEFEKELYMLKLYEEDYLKLINQEKENLKLEGKKQ
jgi:ribosome-binding ATPase YchF (GTP1/OBG family)